MSDGWIGVDLDGTLAEYHGWGDGKIGRPIPIMLNRVKEWLANGNTVKIFTARATDGDQTSIIHEWLKENGLPILEITATKDFRMIELWDDRCVQVIPNTGIPVKEYITARFVKDKRSQA